jgi:hypothetical protein
MLSLLSLEIFGIGSGRECVTGPPAPILAGSHEIYISTGRSQTLMDLRHQSKDTDSGAKSRNVTITHLRLARGTKGRITCTMKYDVHLAVITFQKGKKTGKLPNAASTPCRIINSDSEI